MAEQVQYTEDNIRSLEWNEHIRIRPGMYIGKLGDGSSADDGIYVLLKEIIDNSIDEFVMGHGKTIDITIKENDKYVEVIYQDHGEFNGDLKKLGSLFYKHNSSKGSGIGLYLSKKLMDLMNGEMQITNHQGLNFHLKFEKSEESHA